VMNLGAYVYNVGCIQYLGPSAPLAGASS
jgi:hypothetical protein